VSGQHRERARWFRTPRGRAKQARTGRHTPEYVASHQGSGVGMFPLGAAGRETFKQFMTSPAHRDA
jgi:hypothetical protein